MKELALIAGATAVLIGMSMAAVEQFNDRELFIPPPEAIAEGFVRATLTRRIDQAAEYVAEGTISRSDIRALATSIESRIGHPDDVKAETVSSSKNEAVVSVHLRSATGTETLAATTRWEKSAWKVTGIR